MQKGVFDILNPHHTDWLRHVQVHGNVSRSFDRLSKSHLLVLYNAGEVEIPGRAKATLGLIHPFLVLQVFIPKGCECTVEIGYVDYSNTKRRIVFSQCKAMARHLHHVRMSSSQFKRDIWANLCFDVAALALIGFPGSAFRHIDHVRVTAVCRVRRIFAMKWRLMNTGGDMLPIAYELPKGLKSISQYIGNAIGEDHDKSVSYSPPKSLNPSRARPRPLLKDLFRPLESVKLPILVNRISDPSMSSPRRVHFKQLSDTMRDISFRSALPSRTIDINESPIASEAEEEKSPDAYPGDTFEDESPGLPEVLLPLLQASLYVPHFTPPFVNVMTEDGCHYDPVSRAYGPLLSIRPN